MKDISKTTGTLVIAGAMVIGALGVGAITSTSAQVLYTVSDNGKAKNELRIKIDTPTTTSQEITMNDLIGEKKSLKLRENKLHAKIAKIKALMTAVQPELDALTDR